MYDQGTHSRHHFVLLVVCFSLALIFFVLPVSKTYAIVPQESTFFSSTSVDEHQVYSSASDGDLWASCWADDDNLYASNGDGKGFSIGGPFVDIAMNRISGSPGSLTGTTINAGSISQTWGSTATYNRKPTGMVCVDNNLYVAVQDLNKNFNDAPAATIAKSTNHGTTWTWNTTAPMFNNLFTTIMFLDYGKNNINAPDSYIYAYGLDYNWRDSFNNSVTDPTKLFLARVPKTSIQNRSTWEFYTGDLNGNATWSTNISLKTPVLQDDHLIYQSTRDPANPSNMTVLSQGSVVYDSPLNRYIYTSWTEYTYEFYESPTPFGPWKHFYTKDYGGYPWTTSKNAGYSTTIPSKFISSDGKSMWIQSNTFMGGVSNYNFSLRKLTVVPYVASTASNTKNDTNLARQTGVVPFEKSAHNGNNTFYNDGIYNQSEDSWDQENKTMDFWGYSFNKNINMNKVVYTTGNIYSDGGWFSGGLKVQVRQNFNWVDVAGTVVGPIYPNNNSAGPNKKYTFTFNDISGDAVRIIGTAGGTAHFTSIGELSVYFAGGNKVVDPGFESQTTAVIAAPWVGVGTDSKGIDINNGHAHTGTHSSYIRSSSTNWNQIGQTVAVTPNTDYVVTGWMFATANITAGYFGVSTTSTAVIKDMQFGNTAYAPLTFSFNSGANTSVIIYGGYFGPGADSWINFDDVSLR
ncbi:hypothetical protein EHS13_26475 [Paenibacillus psychroresistens]|uniref:DUF4185 domain-containing protein n=1 Tax=Paenibacillus psychroresistens TaxID=1778678 RepID=A0A6B8RQA0_9BACL|nr:hypothetical protein [Paenibacillus psychroresistens]QGQ98179.1 hypothetical protein EHS13_26475 [Paenibacillus psychroresistens]